MKRQESRRLNLHEIPRCRPVSKSRHSGLSLVLEVHCVAGDKGHARFLFFFFLFSSVRLNRIVVLQTSHETCVL